MPLAMIKIGEKARVSAVGGTDAVKKHLGALGIVPGAILSVVQTVGDSLIVGVHDSRIALNADLAHKVRVMPA